MIQVGALALFIAAVELLRKRTQWAALQLVNLYDSHLLHELSA